MIDLLDVGYVNQQVSMLDMGGIVQGSLTADSDIVDRPGLMYSVTYSTPLLDMETARVFQSQLEQGKRSFVSYLFPLDFRPLPEGDPPHVSGSNPPGTAISLAGLTPYYQFKQGQPIAVIVGSFGYIHRITAPAAMNSSGAGSVNVFPVTRTTFPDNSVVEVEKPRIRGALGWDGVPQGSYGRRAFTFTVTEAR